MSIFAALNDLTKKLKFVKPTIAKCGKTFEKPCVEPLGSLSVSKPKAFITNLSLELSCCLTTRKSAVVSADQRRNLHENFSFFPYSPRDFGLGLEFGLFFERLLPGEVRHVLEGDEVVDDSDALVVAWKVVV